MRFGVVEAINGNIRMLINRGRGYKNMRYLLLKAKRMAVTNIEYVAFQKIREFRVCSGITSLRDQRVTGRGTVPSTWTRGRHDAPGIPEDTAAVARFTFAGGPRISLPARHCAAES